MLHSYLLVKEEVKSALLTEKEEADQSSAGFQTDLIMDLLWLILPVFVVCAEAENLTEVKVELGQNVTLNCSLNASNIYWYMEIHSQFRGGIVRTFADGSTASFVSTFITKYTAEKNRLVITNITAEDCRLYFCARKQSNTIVFEDALRLVSDVPPTPSTNDSEANHQQQQQHIWRMLKSELVLYSSFTLNVLLLLVVTGLICTSLCLKTKNHQVNDPPPLTCGNPEMLETPQYEEIQLPTYRAPPPAGPPLECIYSKAQLPRSTLPRR